MLRIQDNHNGIIKRMQADLRDTVGFVPDHHSKASHTDFFFFWFPSTFKSYVNTILSSIMCVVIALCLKKQH